MPNTSAIGAMGQTLHFALQEKNRNLSRRQTTMKSATAPLGANRRHGGRPRIVEKWNGDLQHLREMTLRSP
jgi:hypothetical protein